MKKLLIALTFVASFAAHGQSPYPSPGPTPLARAGRLNTAGSMMFGPADLATYTPDAFRHSTDTDDTVALQAAVNAAIAAAPAKVLLTRVYHISSGITGVVTPNTGITIEAVNASAGIITSAATGDIFNFTPSGTPSSSDLTTGMRWMTFKDFFVDSSVTRTSGRAFYLQWSDCTSFINVRIGTYNGTVPGTQLAMYDGIFLDKQQNCSVITPQIYCSDVGFTTTGAGGSGGTAYFSFGGYIGGGGYMYGNYATPSIGIHIAGKNGGIVLGQFDCGQWGKYSILVDEALASGTNHELFIRGAFFDAAGVCGCYIGSNSLNILHFDNGWMAGSGRAPGLVFVPGTGFSPENGCGLYVQAPQSTLHINISSGTHIYANNANGITIGDCASMVCVGADIYSNGVCAVSGAGLHGIEIQGGNDILAAFNNLENNPTCPFVIRGTDTGNPIFGSSGSCLGCFSYMFFGNNGTGCGIPGGSEENVNSRTGNMYAGFTMGANYINNGPVPLPTGTTNAFNEALTVAGVNMGVNSGTARVLWSTGTTSQDWEMDNSAGALRTFYGAAGVGTVYETLTPTGLTLPATAEALTLNGKGANSGGYAAGTGVSYESAFNVTGNKQVMWVDPDQVSSTTGGAIRMVFVGGAASLDAVTPTGTPAPMTTASAWSFPAGTTIAGATPAGYLTSPLSGTSIDWSLRGPYTKTIGANTTFTFANQADGQTIVVYVTNTGSYTVTWPTVSWQSGTAPTQTTGSHTDEYTFKKVGSVIYGSAKQNY